MPYDNIQNMKKFYMILPFCNLIVQNHKGEILLGRIPELDYKPYPKRWDLPGGKLEKEETPRECVMRETKEETGYTAKSAKLIDVYHHTEGYAKKQQKSGNLLPGVGLCYKVEISGKFKPDEMEEMGWFSIDEALKKHLTPWSRHFISNYKN